jgi:methyl-accepting chemotaxis protein
MKRRNFKLSTKITLATSSIVIVCLVVLFFTANSNITKIMRQAANDNMITSLESKTQIIEEYVDDAESIMKAYSRASELKALLKDPNNTSIQEAAQKYTEDFYSDLENWEGIYLADFNTHVLAHSSKSAVGMTTRTGDALKSLQNSIRESDELYNAGIILSPASKKLTLSMYCPIYDDDGTTILGYVGGGPFTSNLKTVLDQLVINGLTNVKYTLINLNTGTYIFHEDETLLNTETKDPVLLSIIDEVKKNPKIDKNTIEYTGTDGKKYMAVYKNISDRGWALILSDSSEEIYAQANLNRNILGVLCFISLILIIIISSVVIKSKIRPLKKVTNAAQRIADGDFDVELNVKTRDEIGQLSDTLNLTIRKLQNYQGYIDEISETLEKMEHGDMTVELKRDYVGQFARLKENLYSYIKNTSEVLYNINVASEQVAGGAGQVSNGAQALSQGATEQASSIEQLSAAIMEISDHIKRSAENAKTAREKSNQTSADVIESNQKMQEMIAAMQDISEKSNEISKIIKTIEDIAFQTNILALNAAVEAARAGAAGKGFAVVADEVRNLAGKSAEAAKSTTALIEGTVQAIEKGTQIMNATAESLSTVVQTESAVNEIIQKIAAATDEQAVSVAQVTQGIDQISAVVQTNSATAEESAAASEELSGQAQAMKELVGRFKLPQTDEA